MTQPELTLSPAQDAPSVSLNDAVEPQSGVNHGPMTGARVLVARKMADIVVLPVGILTANERALAGDILLQILDKVDYDLRVDLSDRIARVPDVPETIVRALITDRPDVAAPILEGMEVINDSLLIECVRTGDPAHRLMVARRFGLTTAVADAIFEYNEPDVAKLILRRPECALSQ
ncbi:MAG: DUF2336 domain-containing protein, partial [Pseudomonadota bacterium]